MKKGNFTMNTFNNSRRSFIKNAGVLAIGGTLPVSLVEMAMAACDLNFTLPTPVLLEPFDSLTGFTFSTNSTHALVNVGRLQGSAAIQMNGSGVNVGLSANKAVLTLIDPTTLGTICYAVYKNPDANSIAQVKSYGLSLTRSTQESLSLWTDGPTRFHSGWRWIAANINEFPATITSGVGPLQAKVTTYQASPYKGQVLYDCMYYNANGRPTIVPTFDDIYDTTYTTVFPLFESLGIVGTCYVPIDLIGKANRMTLAQLDELYNAGWDFACDSTRDDSITVLNDTSTALVSINANRDYIAGRGWTRATNHLCWTNGLWNEVTADAFIGAGFLTGRTTEPQSLFDRFGLGNTGITVPGMGFSNTTPINTPVKQLTEVLLRGSTQFFLHHDVKVSPSSLGWQTSLFTDFYTNYVNSQRLAGNLDVLTVSQWYGRCGSATIP